MYDYDALFWLFCSCLFIRYMYFIVGLVLLSYNRYSELPLDRRKYVQKNLIKSVYLAILTLVAAWSIVLPIWRDNYWDNWTIHRLAALYVSNDIVGLVCVDNLPKTTRVHHIVTTVLVFISFGIDFQTSDIGQAMLVYTMASASAYVVNFHLAIRWLCPRGTLKKLRIFAGIVYVICCVFSWSWHVWWIFTMASWSLYHLVYILLLSLIVRDDIILMRWLTN
jgi:hypothetical protein